MKVLINENKFQNLVDKVISDTLFDFFGELKFSINDEGYGRWRSEKWDDQRMYYTNDEQEYKPELPFHKNFYGTLWVEDEEFFETMMKKLKMLGYQGSDTMQRFQDYMSNRYDIKLKGLGLEF
jgi:hypothetical protein